MTTTLRPQRLRRRPVDPSSTRHRFSLRGRRRPTRRATGRDAGALVVEFAVLMPVVLLLLFGTLQAGLFYNARNVASSAAQVGLQSVRYHNGTVDAGTASASAYLDQAGQGTTSREVTGTRTADTASITVSLDSPALIAGMPVPRITASAHAPIDQFLR